MFRSRQSRLPIASMGTDAKPTCPARTAVIPSAARNLIKESQFAARDSSLRLTPLRCVQNDMARSRGPERQTFTTGFTSVPMLSIVMLTTSPSARVNSGGGIVPVPVQTVVPLGTVLWRWSQSAK